MSAKTKIEWTRNADGTPGATWNPVRGCTRVSPGCQSCYAERWSAGPYGAKSPTTGEPFAIFTPSGPRWTGKVELIESMLDIPLRRKKPTTYFVNSMSDLFHEKLPDEAIDRVFAVMALCPQHHFQVLTKRAARMREYHCSGTRHTPIIAAMNALLNVNAAAIRWPLPNVRLGVSAEDQQRADERIPELMKLAAAGWKTFVSAEPLLGAIDFSRFLAYNPVYEVQTKRGVCVPSGPERGLGNRTGRDNLESQETGMGPMEEAGNEPPLQASEGGTRLRSLPSGSDNAEWSKGLRARAPSGLPALQGGYSRRPDSEPRGRQKEAEPPRQPGVSDILRTADPRDQDSEGGTRLQSERDKQFDGEAGGCGDPSNSGAVCGGRRDSGEVSGNVPRNLSDDLRHCKGENKIDGPRPDSGLYDSAQRSPAGPKHDGPIHLIIVGPETGPGARGQLLSRARMEAIVNQCKAAGVPVFVKAVMERGHKLPFEEWPAELQVRETPR